MKNNDHQLFQSAFKFSPIGMAIVSPSGQWLMANSSICSMLGYSAKELSEITFQKITHPDDLEQDLKLLNQVLEGSLSTYQMEKRYIQKNGNLVWGLLSVSLIRNENGEPLYFISQVQDITQLKNAEKQLAENEKLTAIYELSVQLAHEINNPLTIISINCELVDQLLKEPVPDLRFIEQLNIKSAVAAERITDIMKQFKSAESRTKKNSKFSLPSQKEL